MRSVQVNWFSEADVVFAKDQGLVGAVSLIQSNFSSEFVNTGVQGPDNLAVAARVGDKLLYFYRDDQ